MATKRCFFWILVADSLLRKINSLAFDVVGKFLDTVKTVQDWCNKTRLLVNPAKSSVVLFTNN